MPPRKDRKESSSPLFSMGMLVGGLIGVAVTGLVAWAMQEPTTNSDLAVRMSPRHSDNNNKVDAGEDESPTQCVACLAAKPSTIFTDCGHACLCSDCAIRMGEQNGIANGEPLVLPCPLCKRRNALNRLYLP